MAGVMPVRKHRAPKGALRLERAIGSKRSLAEVRKHRAPKGALRLEYDLCASFDEVVKSESTERQKVH